MQTLPQATLSPVLWPDEERAQMLRGSPVLQVRCSSRPRGRATSCHCGSSSQMAAPAGLASANKQQSAQAVLTKTPAQCGRLAGGAHPRAGAAEQAPAGASAYPVAVFNEQAFLEVGWGRRACRTWRWPAAVMHANVALALH